MRLRWSFVGPIVWKKAPSHDILLCYKGIEVLGIKLRRCPPLGRPVVPETVMEAIFAAHPELEGARDDAVPPPVGRTGERPPLVPCLDLPHPRLARLPESTNPAQVR